MAIAMIDCFNLNTVCHSLGPICFHSRRKNISLQNSDRGNIGFSSLIDRLMLQIIVDNLYIHNTDRLLLPKYFKLL